MAIVFSCFFKRSFLPFTKNKQLPCIPSLFRAKLAFASSTSTEGKSLERVVLTTPFFSTKTPYRRSLFQPAFNALSKPNLGKHFAKAEAGTFLVREVVLSALQNDKHYVPMHDMHVQSRVNTGL